MADKTFSIDNDLYMASQYVGQDPIIEKMYRQIDELSQVPEMRDPVVPALKALTSVASQISQNYRNYRITTALAAELLRGITQEQIKLLFDAGYDLDQDS